MKFRRCLVVLVPAVALGACSQSDGAAIDTAAPVETVAPGGTDGTGGAPGGDACIPGEWTSTSMNAPAQAAITAITPTGGGEGARLTFTADGTFQIDFGPMQPVTATFTTGDQEGTLRTTLAGVEAGTWSTAADGTVTATTDDFTTAKATAELILGDTVPPIFDEPFNLLNDNRMLGGAKVGVWSVSDCTASTLTMQSPFPGGTLTLVAEK